MASACNQPRRQHGLQSTITPPLHKWRRELKIITTSLTIIRDSHLGYQPITYWFGPTRRWKLFRLHPVLCRHQGRRRALCFGHTWISPRPKAQLAQPFARRIPIMCRRQSRRPGEEPNMHVVGTGSDHPHRLTAMRSWPAARRLGHAVSAHSEVDHRSCLPDDRVGSGQM